MSALALDFILLRMAGVFTGCKLKYFKTKPKPENGVRFTYHLNPNGISKPDHVFATDPVFEPVLTPFLSRFVAGPGRRLISALDSVEVGSALQGTHNP